MPDTWGSAGWGDSERSWDRTDGNKWDQGSDRNKDGEQKWDRGWGRVDERGDAKWERGDDHYSNGWGHSTSSETPASSSWQRRGETSSYDSKYNARPAKAHYDEAPYRSRGYYSSTREETPSHGFRRDQEPTRTTWGGGTWNDATDHRRQYNQTNTRDKPPARTPSWMTAPKSPAKNSAQADKQESKSEDKESPGKEDYNQFVKDFAANAAKRPQVEKSSGSEQPVEESPSKPVDGVVVSRRFPEPSKEPPWQNEWGETQWQINWRKAKGINRLSISRIR